MRFDTTAQPCIMASIVGNRSKPCATRVARDRRKVHRNGMTIGSSPTAPSTTRATLARIQPTTFDHFDERWSRQSDEKHTAVDPARDAELMTRHTGEALRIDDRSRSNRAVDLTSLQSGFTSDPAMLQLDNREARGRQLPRILTAECSTKERLGYVGLRCGPRKIGAAIPCNGKVDFSNADSPGRQVGRVRSRTQLFGEDAQ